MTFNEALRVVQSLSKVDRLRLADMIWEQADSESEGEPLTPAQQTELKRRLDDHRKNPAAGIPWEQVREETRVRRGR